MEELGKYLDEMIGAGISKIVISNPAGRQETYRKIQIDRKNKSYQISKFTDTQVFHENLTEEYLGERCQELIRGHFRQVNGWSQNQEHIILISKKGACSYRVKRKDHPSARISSPEHNRKKNYILQEGTEIKPLVDMGIFTKEGRIVHSMYDKYKQINRFLEILEDELSHRRQDQINVIDFGCGKSYLTFVVYYYLSQVREMQVNMVGLDLKRAVIEKCNETAEKYRYTGLRFEQGDINGYKAPFPVDMVITLHACDTATDYALYNAVRWNAGMIFSVPCCQHELNRQMKPQNLSILSRYGIIKERFSALATDAARANLLEYRGYKTQLLEFIDFEHTPKNILIRAVRSPMLPGSVRERALGEVHELMKEFGFMPTLYKLLVMEHRDEEDGMPQ